MLLQCHAYEHRTALNSNEVFSGLNEKIMIIAWRRVCAIQMGTNLEMQRILCLSTEKKMQRTTNGEKNVQVFFMCKKMCRKAFHINIGNAIQCSV